MAKTAENATGMIVKGGGDVEDCEACRQATAKRIVSRASSIRPVQPYAEVSVDLVTVSDTAIGQERYFTLFTDSTTLYRHVFFSPSKSGASAHVREHVRYVQTQLGRTIKVLRLDGGREYGGRPLKAFAAEQGMRLHVTTPHNSEQNGRAEVSNNIVCVTARKMMLHGKLPKALWPEAVKAAVYILNLVPSNALKNNSPYQLLAEHENWSVRDPVWPISERMDVGPMCTTRPCRGAQSLTVELKWGALSGSNCWNDFSCAAYGSLVQCSAACAAAWNRTDTMVYIDAVVL